MTLASLSSATPAALAVCHHPASPTNHFVNSLTSNWYRNLRVGPARRVVGVSVVFLLGGAAVRSDPCPIVLLRAPTHEIWSYDTDVLLPFHHDLTVYYFLCCNLTIFLFTRNISPFSSRVSVPISQVSSNRVLHRAPSWSSFSQPTTSFRNAAKHTHQLLFFDTQEHQAIEPSVPTLHIIFT